MTARVTRTIVKLFIFGVSIRAKYFRLWRNLFVSDCLLVLSNGLAVTENAKALLVAVKLLSVERGNHFGGDLHDGISLGTIT